MKIPLLHSKSAQKTATPQLPGSDTLEMAMEHMDNINANASMHAVDKGLKTRVILSGILPVLIIVLLLAIIAGWRLSTRPEEVVDKQIDITDVDNNRVPTIVTGDSLPERRRVVFDQQVIANGSIILSPSVQPAEAIAGQVYFDEISGDLQVYDGQDFLQIVSIQADQEICFVGSDCGFATSEDLVALELPQDLAVTASPSFAGLNLSGALSVLNGGTGVTSFTNNSVILGSGNAALRSSNAATAGQLLLASASGIPRFISLSGDVLIAPSGVASLNPNSVGSDEIQSSGVIAGTYGDVTDYPVFTVDEDGRIIAASTLPVPGGGGGVGSLNALVGAITLQGTANQVNVTTGVNTITLSTPQNIAVNSSPTFNGLSISSLTLGTDTVTDIAGTGLQVVGGALQTTIGTSVDGSEIVDGSVGNVDLANSSLTVTASGGLSGGGVVSLGGTVVLSLTNDFGASIDSSEITNGTILFEDIAQNGCSDDDVIKWDSGAWVCGLDATGSGTNTFATIATPAGTNPVADNTSDTLTLLNGAGITITGNAATDEITIASLLGASIDTSEIDDDTILEADLDVTNAPTDNYVLTFDQASGGFTWVDPASVGIAYDFDISDGVTTETIGNGDAITFASGSNISAIVSATDTLTISVISAPTFSGLVTLNGGLTLEAGDTFTFNGDAFTDLTGSGLQVTSNALTLSLQANKGLEVDGNGLSLIDCGDNEILKYSTGTSQWGCAPDAGGSGVGDDVLVNGGNATNANFINTTASGTVAGVTWSLNTTPSPDEISLTVSNASDTVAGVVTTDAQTFAGAKTFNNGITIAAAQTLTIGGDSIDEFAGNGLTVSSGDLQVDTAYFNTNYIQNQNSTNQTGDFRISGTGRANTSFISPSIDSISGALTIGTTTATSIVAGNTSNTATLSLQGTTAATYTIGTATGTGTITLGQSTATNTISLGSANGINATQTINIGGGTSSGSGGKTINIATGTPGNSTTNQINIGTGGSTTGIVDVNIGSNAGAAHTVDILAGNTGGGININTSGANINIGTSGFAYTTTIGNQTSGSILNLNGGTSVGIDGIGATTFSIAGSATTGTLTIGSTIQTGAITLGRSTASNTINIGNANTATGNTQTINIGAGTPAGTGQTSITIGNTVNAGSLNLRSGTGNISLQAGSGSVIFSGMTTDITTGTNQDLTVVANGSGIINLNDATTITGAANINTSGSAVTNIGTGTYSGTVAIGNSASTLTVLGTTTINTTGTAATSIGNSGAVTTLTGSSILLNSATLQRTAAGTTSLDLVDGANTTLALINSGAGVANLTVDGAITVAALGTADTATFLCRNSSNIIAGCNYTPLNPNLTDNIADAFDLQEGTNNYININTTNGSENISFGNATTNPSYNFLGSGTLAVAGAQTIGGNLTVDTDTLFVDSSANRVGIGTATPSASLDIVYTDSGTTAATTYGSRLQVTDNGVIAAGQDNIYGQHIQVDRTGSSSGTTNTYGQYIVSSSTAGSTYGLWTAANGGSQAVGLSASAYSNQASASVQGVYITATSDGTLTSLNGLTVSTYADSGSVDTASGIVVTSDLSGGTADDAAGIIIEGGLAATNSTNLLIGTTSIPLGNYSIYNASTDDNVFAGDLRIGSTTAPTVALDVTGAGAFSGNLSVDTDVLYVDSSANRVGIGTTSLDAKLAIRHSSATETALSLQVRGDQDSSTDLFVALDAGGQKRSWINEKGELRTRAAEDNSVALRVKQNSGTQTGHLLQLTDASNAVLTFFDGEGRLGVGYAPVSNTADAAATVAIDSVTNSDIALLVRGNSTSQSGDLIQAVDNTTNNNTLFSLGASGVVNFQNATNTDAAFNIRRANGVAMFVVDTTNNRVGTGTTTGATTNSQLFTIRSGDATGSGSNSGDVVIRTGSVNDGTVGDLQLEVGSPSSGSNFGNIFIGSNYRSNSINIGSVGSSSRNSTVNIANTSASNTQVVNIGSSVNASSSVLISGGSTGGVTLSSSATVLGAPSTSATQLEVRDGNSSTVTLLVVDSVNDRVYIGDTTPDATGTLLVLDTKNNAGDPTGVDGAMYYNSSLGKFRCFENGVWTNCSDPSSIAAAIILHEDFFSQNTGNSNSIGTHGWLNDNVNCSFSNLSYSNTDSADRVGIMDLSTGGSSTGCTLLRIGFSNSWRTGGNTTVEMGVRLPTLSTGTQEYVVRVGLSDGNTAEATDGIYWEYDRTVSTNWQLVTAAGATRTKMASSTSGCSAGGTPVAVAAGTWYNLKYVINSATNQVDAYINDTFVGCSTTNIPTGSQMFSPQLNITKSVGTFSRSLEVDFFSLVRPLTTKR